jgi:prepilin-type processing-associated H-X9-DG protein
MGLSVNLARVLRPAETAIVSDALTAYDKTGNLFTSFGCESAGFHQNGANYIFLDGHAHKIVGNAERYLKQASNGNGTWFEQYFTYDLE